MHRPAIASLALAALCVIGVVVCTVLHVDAPSILSTIGLVSVSAGVGIAVPAIAASASDSTSAPATPTTQPEAYTGPLGG